jgi:DNA relaxase NicK
MNSEQEIVDEKLENKMIRNELIQIKNDIQYLKERVKELVSFLKNQTESDNTELIMMMKEIYDAKCN